MRLVPILLLAAGCTLKSAAPPVVTLDPPRESSATTVVASQVEEAPLPPQPPAATVVTPQPEAPEPPPPPPPPECTGSRALKGTRWIGRFLSTGIMPGPDRIETFAFGREGSRATFVFEEKVAKKLPERRGRDEWQCAESLRLSGKVEEQHGKLVFTFEDAARPLDPQRVTCKPRSLTVAAATAVRVPIPSDQEGCNRNRWSPAPGVGIQAFECVAEYVAGGESRSIFVSQAPGLEHVTIDCDDCWDPADSLRVVASEDGEPAPVGR